MNGHIVAICATTREQRAREETNAADYDRQRAITAVLRDLDHALKAARRFALTRSEHAAQVTSDRHWHAMSVAYALDVCTDRLTELGETP